MNKWQGKKVLVIGAARQGAAASRYLAEMGAHVTLNDARPTTEFNHIEKQFTDLDIEFQFGGHPSHLLENTDYLCISGGVPLTLPLIQKAIEMEIPLTNDSQLFMEEVKGRVIGITGSAGKTTTTTLLGAIAKEEIQPQRKAWIGGNIGNPMISYLDEIERDDWVILELSSFQLELMTISPKTAVVLNITPNHLDRHLSMKAYTQAKARIVGFQKEEDTTILNRDDPGSVSLTGMVPGKLLTFGFRVTNNLPDDVFFEKDCIKIKSDSKVIGSIPSGAVRLHGKHNLSNTMAACCAALSAGFSIEAMEKGIRSVSSIPHRLELVREYKGVRWMNDSIATAPERVIAALRAINGKTVLLLGGRDKDLPWKDLASVLHEEKPKVILFGEAADLISEQLKNFEKGEIPYPVLNTKTMEEAVQQASRIAESGETVLLSPGGTSFDTYQDFEERGEHFRKLVEDIT